MRSSSPSGAAPGSCEGSAGGGSGAAAGFAPFFARGATNLVLRNGADGLLDAIERLVRQALQALTPDDRLAIVLVDFQQNSYA